MNATCNVCGRPPDFECRAHFVAERAQLRADLAHEREGHQNAVDNWNKAAAERDTVIVLYNGRSDEVAKLRAVVEAVKATLTIETPAAVLAALAALDGAR